MTKQVQSDATDIPVLRAQSCVDRSNTIRMWPSLPHKLQTAFPVGKFAGRCLVGLGDHLLKRAASKAPIRGANRDRAWSATS